MINVTRSLCFLTLLLAALHQHTLSAQTADTIRVCTYNLEDFSGEDGSVTTDLYSVLSRIEPTILVIQGLRLSSDLSAFPLFRSSVANALSTPLTGFSFFDADDEFQVAILYDKEALTFLPDPGEIDTRPVVHAYMRFVVQATDDTLIVVTGQWQEGSSVEDRTIRTETAGIVREAIDLLDNGSRNSDAEPLMIVAGTFNLRGSQADAWGILTGEEETDGRLRLYDPADRPGPWSSDSNFSAVHTHNTRIQIEDGDTTGGLNDRFDQIFLSSGLLGRVIPGSYTVFGNDGHLFRKPVTDENNSAVISPVALSLSIASDHLPVFVDLIFGRISSVTTEEVPETGTELDLSARE